MSSLVVSIVVVAIVSMMVTRPGAANTIRTIGQQFSIAISNTLGVER